MVAAAAAAGAAHVLHPTLWIAAKEGRVEEVRRLLDEEVDIEERGGRYQTSPLHEAVLNNREEVVRVLLTHGADASTEDSWGKTALHHFHGFVEILLLLLQNGAEVSKRDNSDRTPLHGAAFNGLEEVVLILLDHGADVSSTTDFGITPLHCAAHNGHATVVPLLLDKGADFQWKTDGGRTAEDIAIVQSHPYIAEMIRVEAERREAVHRARCEAFTWGITSGWGWGRGFNVFVMWR